MTQDCTLGKDIDTSATPDKTGIEKEKQNLDKMKVNNIKFTRERTFHKTCEIKEETNQYCINLTDNPGLLKDKKQNIK